MKLTYFGHSCFSAEVGDSVLLFDPFIRDNESAKSIDIDTIKADYILISHGHFDHIADAEYIAKKTGAKIIANYEICNWLANKGVTENYPMNIGGSWILDDFRVKYVSAAHSSVMPDGVYGGVAGGFLIESEKVKFYFAGDTGLHLDMKLIGEYKQLDFAILPIGDVFTMGIDNAILCSEFIKCSKIIGMHYNTFPYIKINKTNAKERFKKADKKLILLNIGETKEIYK